MKKLALALVAAAVLAPAAAAGGFATVGLSSLPPQDVQAGGAWTVDLTILQHGRTPLDHLQPAVRLHGPGGEYQEFPAAPTGEPGVYRAEVRFPAAGTWRYEVDDGFTQVHTYRPVTVGSAPAPSSFPLLPVGALALALVLAAALALFLRRQRPSPQPAPLGS